MSKIGLNINLGSVGDYNRLIRVLKGMSRTRIHLVMTGGTEPDKERQDVINLINAVGNSNTLYLHRLYSREEGHWRNLTPERFRPVLRAMQSHPQIITEQPTNEPGDADNAEFVENQVGILNYAIEDGEPIALGAWGVGGASEHTIENGIYDRLYQKIHEANQRRKGSAYLSKHEYHYVWAEAGAGFNDIPYEVLLEPKKLRNHLKPKAAWDIRKGRWLIRRSDWDAMRCMHLGFAPVPMVFSEYGWDGVDDPITKLNHLVYPPGQTPQGILDEFGLTANATNTGFADKLLGKYRVHPYNGLRGVGANRNILKAIFPDLSFPQAVEFMLRHHNDDILHPEHIVGACLFTWNFSGEWGGNTNTSGHNYGQEGLDDTLITIGSLPDPTPLGTSPTPPVPPQPEPTPEPENPLPEWRLMHIEGWNAVLKKAVTPNIRLTPNGTIIGFLSAYPTVSVAKVSLAPAIQQDSYEWVQIILHPDTDRAVTGWIANHVFREATAANVPDYRGWYEEDLLRQRQYHIVKVSEHTEEIMQIDNKLELLRAS